MKLIYVLILSICLFIPTSCSERSRDQELTGNGDIEVSMPDLTIKNEKNSEEGEIVIFDRENTVLVIQETLIQEIENCTVAQAERIMRALLEAGLYGAISAEFVEFSDGHLPTMEIKSEDNKVYHLHLFYARDGGCKVEAISDAETGKVIYVNH